jgi:hypothetical protein
MDTAFATGVDDVGGFIESYRPEDVDNPRAFEIAREHHPRWNCLSHYVKRLMARNVQIILGRDIARPVDMVLYWNPIDTKRGGTLFGLRVAAAHDIPINRIDSPVIVSVVSGLIKHQMEGLSLDREFVRLSNDPDLIVSTEQGWDDYRAGNVVSLSDRKPTER